jgi:hypothetical protein
MCISTPSSHGEGMQINQPSCQRLKLVDTTSYTNHFINRGAPTPPSPSVDLLSAFTAVGGARRPSGAGASQIKINLWKKSISVTSTASKARASLPTEAANGFRNGAGPSSSPPSSSSPSERRTRRRSALWWQRHFPQCSR